MKKTILSIIFSITLSLFSQNTEYISILTSADTEAIRSQFIFDEYIMDRSADEFTYWMMQASRGNEDAYYIIANSYFTGKGVNKNEQKAFDNWKLAAAKNQKAAQLNTGICYFLGIGGNKDYIKAAECFNKVLKKDLQGFNFDGYEIYSLEGNANYLLGICYITGGYGIIKDEVKAFNFFRAAANSNHNEGQWELGNCYERGIGVNKNMDLAITNIKKAANGRSLRAMLDLGTRYEYGNLVEKDCNQAVYWYDKILTRTKKEGGDFYWIGNKVDRLRQQGYSPLIPHRLVILKLVQATLHLISPEEIG